MALVTHETTNRSPAGFSGISPRLRRDRVPLAHLRFCPSPWGLGTTLRNFQTPNGRLHLHLWSNCHNYRFQRLRNPQGMRRLLPQEHKQHLSGSLIPVFDWYSVQVKNQFIPEPHYPATGRETWDSEAELPRKGGTSRRTCLWTDQHGRFSA